MSGPTPDGSVVMTDHNLFERTGQLVVNDTVLVFREASSIRRDLEDAGFAVHAVCGDWSGTPWQPSDPLMVFRAEAI